MIVWGGNVGGTATTGGRYDPATDSWAPTSIDRRARRPAIGHTGGLDRHRDDRLGG